VAWFDKPVVSFKQTFDRATTLNNIALDSARESHIVFRMNINFKVKLCVDFWVYQRENSLEDD
jgi:hypothetical protein